MRTSNLLPELKQAQALAWQLLQKGNPDGAEEALKPLLARGVQDELSPTLAVIRLQQKRFPEAASLLERVRSLLPADARFAYLHGGALTGMDQWDKGITAFQEAVKRDPNFADAYLALGQAQRKLRRFEDAQNTYRKLLRVQPENVEGTTGLASALAEMGDHAQAEAVLRRALLYAQGPKAQAGIQCDLANVLRAQDKGEEALQCLERAQDLAPDMPNIDERRIDILSALGRFGDCEQLYMKLLKRNPGDPHIHRAYNSMLYRLGRIELASYDRAPQTRELLLGKAEMLAYQRRSAEAHEIYAGLLTRDPQDMAAAAGVAGSLLLLGRFGDAAARFEDLLKRPGATAEMFVNGAKAALMAGDYDKAEFFCQSGLRGDRYDQGCLTLLGTAWRLKGDARDEELNDPERLVHCMDLDPPEGFSSMESFNAELGAWLESQHPKTGEYVEQSLRGGTQTQGFLFGSGQMLIRKLKVCIDEAVARYVAELPVDETHPFLARRGRDFRYTGAWSSLMREQGFHENHMHPGGWISSCYYVTVPEAAQDQDAKLGWIKFGEPSLPLPLKNPVRRAIQPVPGRLLLFPSYMWHGTNPFHAPAVRTTIAFDAVPGGQA
ncbi:MAG TPA: tetratricopeptide repeat protein [Rhizomicrobium sp.]|nr:tetratricopeptide repeat protein [Rhizomicrobium sp.]